MQYFMTSYFEKFSSCLVEYEINGLRRGGKKVSTIAYPSCGR